VVRASILTVFSLEIILVLPPAVLWAQPELEYQNRGDYFEGIRPKPVSGYAIEVLSALVDYKEPATRLPDQLRVRFYLDKEADVHLVVREQDYKLFYWLDKVKPPHSWRGGSYNEFAWPTKNVLQRLDQNIDMYKLGVLIRVGHPTPARVERLAPAVLYHSTAPASIPGYLFTMKTNGDARLSCSVYLKGKSEPLSTETFTRTLGGLPFTVRWDARGAGDGDYTLVCRGFFLDTNQGLEQTISFHHLPRAQ
jgi:hypothetical protein